LIKESNGIYLIPGIALVVLWVEKFWKRLKREN